MAINKNHEFEELDGVKCGIVEKNVTAQRVAFLKELLEFNGYTVVTVPTPPPKVVVAKSTPGEETTQPPTSNLPTGQAGIEPPAPETFTLGVTDYTFNTINAIFGRMLKTPDGHFVTLAYWQQNEAVSDDEVPYYEKEI